MLHTPLCSAHPRYMIKDDDTSAGPPTRLVTCTVHVPVGMQAFVDSLRGNYYPKFYGALKVAYQALKRFPVFRRRISLKIAEKGDSSGDVQADTRR